MTMGNKLYVIALAGCVLAASAYVVRQRSRLQEARQCKEDLQTTPSTTPPQAD
jgi:HAMP domain-containing protein